MNNIQKIRNKKKEKKKGKMLELLENLSVFNI